MNNIDLIFGAPGTGKTTYLIDILEKELKENDPDKIAYVSFTRKGTYEGKNRAMEKFGYSEKELPYFRTLHSIAFKEGNYSKYDMISKKDYKTFSKALGMNFTGYYTEEFYNNDDKYLFLNFLERNNITMAELYLSEIDIKIYNMVTENYIRYKKHANVVDFTDILESFIERNKSLPVDIAVIDEAQDLTTLQWQMCEIAFRDCKKVYIAGDDDQAIFEWSGADVNYFLAIKGKQIILKQSYRLQEKVLEYSKRISDKITNRVYKDFHAIGDEGEIHFYNNINELSINPDETYYFLSRNNYFLFYYREFLKKQAQVFMDKNTISYKPEDIKMINLFEKVRRTHQMNSVEKVKITDFLKPNVTMNLKKPWFDNLNFTNDTMAYYKDLIRTKADLNKCLITINTIHGVKGGEADNVVLILDFTRSVSANFEINPDSELRCLYVACTRAKKNLHIVYSNTKSGYEDFVHMEE